MRHIDSVSGGRKPPQTGKTLPACLPVPVTTHVRAALTALADKRPMRGQTSIIAGMLLVCATGAEARSAMSQDFGGGPGTAMSGTLECVPFARDTSGIRIYGDAHTWWNQAAGKYARGTLPKPGAVLAIRPHGNSTLGHVATVSRIIDERTILISHANWSSPGQIERNVTVTDVSAENDWSEVRVWYAPIQNLGAAHWPVAGFIYNAKPQVAPAKAQNVKVEKPGRTGSTMTKFVAPKTTLVRFGDASGMVSLSKDRVVTRATTTRAAAKPASAVHKRKDPIGAILAGAY